MLLQTNSYIVPKERRAEHARLLRRFRQVLLRVGCDLFEVYEQMGPNWTAGDGSGRYVQIMRFRDRKHQRQVHAAEQSDPAAQQLIAEFCELVNIPYQQQQGLLAVGYYQGVMDVPAGAIARQAVATTGFESMPAAPAGFGLPTAAAAATAMGFGVAEGFGQHSESEEEADGEEDTAADEEEVAGREAVEEEAVEEEAVEEQAEVAEAEEELADAEVEEVAAAEEDPTEIEVEDLFADALEAETEETAVAEESEEEVAEGEAATEVAEVDDAEGDELALSDLQSLDFGLEEDAEPAVAEATPTSAEVLVPETESSATEEAVTAETQAVPGIAEPATEEVGSDALLGDNWADDLLDQSTAAEAEPTAIESVEEEAPEGVEAGAEKGASAADIFGLEFEGEAAVDDSEATHTSLNGAMTAAAITPVEAPTEEPTDEASEGAATALSAEGLPMHLVADEAEIEILYEAMPDFGHASTNGSQSDELAADEIDAALNEALQD